MYNRKAIIAFVCALFFPIPLFNIMLAVVAVISGVFALKEIRKQKQQGKWLVIVAFVIAALIFLAYLLYGLIWLLQ